MLRNRWALIGVVALLPIWGILVPGTVIWLLISILKNFSAFTDHMLPFIGAILGLLMISMVGVKAVLNLADNNIVISKVGIELPFFLGSTFGLRRNFAWAAIRKADVVESEHKCEIVIYTADGFPVYLNVKCFAPEELEQLLVALNVWAQNCEKNPALELLHDKLQKDSDARLLPNYTAMWEEELAHRFSSTAYVPLEPGHVLQSGKLKVVNQLSFGGLSAVYLCQRDERDLVVLKEAVIPDDGDSEIKQKSMEFLLRESRMLAKLEHPAIVKVLDCFVEAGRHYLLIEYHSGQDLNQFVKQNGAQPEEKVLRWTLEIADILDYLHSHDPPIIHRDVTPDNLVLEAGGSIVMIDFGTANEFLGKATGTLVGKQSFIAPEQFRGKACVQSDFYALGCTLHFLLTGQEPVPLSVSHPRTANAAVSAEVDNLVALLTAMDVEERIPSAEELKNRILALLAREPALM